MALQGGLSRGRSLSSLSPSLGLQQHLSPVVAPALLVVLAPSWGCWFCGSGHTLLPLLLWSRVGGVWPIPSVTSLCGRCLTWIWFSRWDSDWHSVLIKRPTFGMVPLSLGTFKSVQHRRSQDVWGLLCFSLKTGRRKDIVRQNSFGESTNKR